MNRSSRAAALLLPVLLLFGCSSTTDSPASSPASSRLATQGAAAAASAAQPGADRSCTGGLSGSEPGVLRITCNGTATLQVRAGGVGKTFRGGECHSAGDVWSAAAGVIIDKTGMHGKYAGPPVDSVAINNTDTPGVATIQLALGGKLYFSLGDAKLSLTSGGRSAHVEGASDRQSDAPGAKLTVDVTC